MTKHEAVAVTLPADVQQIDRAGFVWTFFDEAEDLIDERTSSTRSPPPRRERRR